MYYEEQNPAESYDAEAGWGAFDPGYDCGDYGDCGW